MPILAIDPGPSKSAYLIWNYHNNSIVSCGIKDNPEMLSILREKDNFHLSETLIPVVEMIQSFGMPVGKEIFETVLIIGRIIEIFAGNVNLVYRKDIKIHFCGTARAKDGNIRQALIDRFGKPGTKKVPGILYGVSKDVWSALALCIFWQDKTEFYAQNRYQERNGMGGPSEEAIQRARERRDFEDYKREQEDRQKRDQQERENEKWQDRMREERERKRDSQENQERRRRLSPQ